MTDNEIIKALECLISKAGHENHRCCKGCVYEKQCKTECGANIVEYALDLIKRQKAEIERLQLPKFLVENTLSKEEISEMLKMGRVGLIPYIDYSIRRIDEDIIRAEAITEVLERLKFELEVAFDEPIFDTIIGKIIESTIDKILKEMIGDK